MINRVTKFGLFSLIIILLQILLFNNIQFSGYVNPYVYIIIILLMPADIQAWVVLLVAFATGLIVDFSSGTPGMHASATLAAGFSRHHVLRLIAPREGYEPGSELSMTNYGIYWFLLYTSIIVLIHHTILFFIEVFRFDGFFRTVLRILLSTLFTAGFVLIAEFYRKKRKQSPR